MKSDTVTKVMLETIQAAGDPVTGMPNQVSATDSTTNERFIVRFDNVDRLYQAAAGLAEAVGLELDHIRNRPRRPDQVYTLNS